ncbi:MAG: hypothetical protein GXO75_06305, partial [Calditrichaeota bacterium]|nr:hypothetical protein [Calditrichota bacterium]
IELKLYSLNGENPFGENSITELFKIEGLPITYSQPLFLQLKYQGSLANSSAIALGEELFIKSLGTTTTSFQMLSAKDSSGFLIVQLPVPQSSSNQSGLLKNSQPKETTEPIKLQGITDFSPFLSSSGHFKISSTDKTVSLQDARALGDYLEDAFDTIKARGFQHESKRSWPVEITIKELANTVYGYAAYSMFTGGYLEFNSKKITDHAEIRLTSGHEFFHLVQALYDNRNSYSKAKFSSDHFWLDEATAVWIEEKFTDQANYVSPIRNGHEMAPIEGMEKGAETDAGNHGYGMSAVIKYLCNIYSEDILVEMYEQIFNGSSAVDAIKSATEDPDLWYEKFLRQYVLGQIYNVQLASWVGNKSGEFTISSKNDTLKNFSGSYPDLSAKLYQVKLIYSDIDSSAKLAFSANGGKNEITVFKYKSGSIEYVDNHAEKLTIPDVRKIKDEGWNLFVLVTNSKSVSPYTSTSDINLEIKLTIPVWQVCSFLVQCEGYYRTQYLDYPDSVNYAWSPLAPTFGGYTNGYFTGNTFTGSWDTIDVELGDFDRGSITVTLNESRNMILSFQITQITGTIQGNPLEEIWQEACSGTNIPWETNSLWGPLYFKVEGSETCNHLASVESVWEPSYFPILYTLQDYKCTDGSEIEISFENDSPNLQKRVKRLKALKARARQKARTY